MYFLIKFLLLLLSLSSRFFFLLSDVHELWLQPVTSSLFSSAHMMSCTYDVIAHRGKVTSWLKWSSSWVFYGFGFRMRSLLFNNKTLMKVVLTLSFVSNERVTDLMSHDAEEIWWGHPLNFSQWVLQVFLETVSSAFALLVQVSVKQSSVFFVFQTGRCDVVSSRVRASYLWDWRDAGTWKIPLMTNCPNSLNIS